MRSIRAGPYVRPVTGENDSTRAARVLFWVAVRRIYALQREVEVLRRSEARLEEEATLRAATIANELTVRMYDAESSHERLRASLQRALGEDLADDALRRRLGALLADNE